MRQRAGWTDRRTDGDSDLVSPAAVVEAHACEGRELGLHALLVVLQLLSLDLFSHLPGLLDGLHHRILVPEQRCGVQAGQDVWGGSHTQLTHTHSRYTFTLFILIQSE